MYEIEFVNTMNDFLEHTQIISLLQDQMDYINSPKTNTELLETFKLVFAEDNAHLVVISEQSNIVGFAYFNVCIGMKSAGKYLWLNEIHIHKEYRFRGIGKLLVAELKKWSKVNQVVRIMGIADHNDVKSQDFYKGQGAEIRNQDLFSMDL